MISSRKQSDAGWKSLLILARTETKPGYITGSETGTSGNWTASPSNEFLRRN